MRKSDLVALLKLRKVSNELKEEIKSWSLEDLEKVDKKDFAGLFEKDVEELSAKIEDYFQRNEYIYLITIWDEEYPAEFKDLWDFPIFFFAKTKRELSELFAYEKFSIVGTRKITNYGIKVTKELTRALCERFTIVSGMADGVDSFAHREALENRRNTIAVLGCGVDVVYPASNRNLYNKIIENGCALSEYLPWEKPQKYRFVERNRLVASLGVGTLVTEAGEKSGALITAKFALDLGKDVFAVPGDVTKESSKGCNYLIKNGAIPVTCPEDILSYYGFEIHKKLVNLSEEEYNIFKHLSEYSSIEELSKILEKTPSEVMVALTVLELKGVVYRNIDGRYIRGDYVEISRDS